MYMHYNYQSYNVYVLFRISSNIKIVLLYVNLLIKAEILKRHSVFMFTANVFDTQVKYIYIQMTGM